jgi:precorrin-3B C17-methyltransferase
MSGKIYLVGIGPGQPELVTPQARETLARVRVVIGQPETIAFIRDLTRGKEVLAVTSNPLERSRLAVEKARDGQDVAIVSSGDPGVYAIAATFFSYMQEQGLTLDVEVVPGLGIAAYAAARLGAPLGGDSASISLSDHGTPWEIIINRLEAVASADFVIIIYNPFGKLGPDRLREALEIVRGHRPVTTPVGLLSQAATSDEKLWITTLGEAPADLPADSLIIIGSSRTFVEGGRMVTPRNYIPGTGY